MASDDQYWKRCYSSPCLLFIRYRKWDLGNDVVLIARTEHDAVTSGPNNETHYMNIKALNEWDSRVSDKTGDSPKSFTSYLSRDST